jgi:hypothetical protein
MTFPSERGRIQPPDLDDRTWQDLVDEIKTLIPRYAPQWTDHSPSDPGIALIELFAWLVEGLIYRLNRVPDKNYLAMLKILGVTRNPPTPAMTYLTFTNPTDQIDLIRHVAAGSQFQTPGSEQQRPIVFETDDDVDVSPLNLEGAVVLQAANGAPAMATDFTISVLGSTRGRPTEKISLTVAPAQTTQICLGFKLPATLKDGDQPLVRLALRLYQSAPAAVLPDGAAGPGAQPLQLSLSGCFSSSDQTDPLSWPTAIDGKDIWTDQTADLQRDGDVELTLPSTWTQQRPVKPNLDAPPPIPVWSNLAVDQVLNSDALWWVGLRLTTTTATPVAIGIDRILFNSAAAHNALTIGAPEDLGASTGEPFQVFSLSSYPLYTPFGADTAPPDLIVEVSDGTDGVWRSWTQVDELPPEPLEVYLCNLITGEISFGDIDSSTGRPHAPANSTGAATGHGLIPAKGSKIRASRYRAVAGGSSGNVRPRTVTDIGKDAGGQAVNGVTVTNHGPGFDGSDEEAVDETLLRAPDVLKSHDRAVTADDYEVLARQATTDVAIARCLAPALHSDTNIQIGGNPAWQNGDPWTFAGIVRAPGSVHVIIVPDQGDAIARPEPSRALLDQVQHYLDEKRDVTAVLQVHGPYYVPIQVTATIRIWPQASNAGATEDNVKKDTTNKINAYLHPTRGGLDGHGWQPGQSVYVADLYRAIALPEETGYIENLQVAPMQPLYIPGVKVADFQRPFAPFPKNPASSVRIADYELVCAAGSHVVTPKKVDT